MYSFMARPQTGHIVPAEHSFHSFHDSKFHRAHNSVFGKQCRSRNLVVVLASVAISLLLFGTLGCGVDVRGASKTADPATASLAASPSTVDFGTVTVGNSSNQKVTVANIGSDSVAITSLTTSSGAFSVNGQVALPVNLAAGKSLSFNVHFSPKDDTDSTGEVSIVSDSSSIATTSVKLHGKGGKKSSSSSDASLSGLSCAKSSMSGAGEDTCTVTLTSAAPSAGLVVNLASSSKAITVPTSVTVASGASSAGFIANASAVTAEQTVTLTATQGSTSKQTSITLSSTSSPTVAAPSVSALSCESNSFTGSGTTNCTVSLSSAAAEGGTGVSLGSSSTALTVPGSVTVAAGATVGSFTAKIAAVSTSQTATITASANSSSRSYALQLKAANSLLSLSTTSLAFGNVAVGTAVTKSVTVTSSGTVDVTVKSDAITGTGFSVSGGNLPVTLSPGQAAVLTVQYAPTTSSTSSGQLTISSSASTATVSLSGTGTTTAPALSALACGSTSITGALTDSCTLSLSGSAPSGGVTVALASSSSSVKVPSSLTVPATQKSATFTADVAAVSTAKSVTLTATSGSTSKAVSLNLSPGTSTLSVNATSISFGSTALNTPTSQSLTLTASGSASVTIKSVAITGAGFSVSSETYPITLSPGQSVSLDLQFNPTTAGDATGQLTINSNSSSNPTTVVSLSGTGASTAHKVNLSWDAPTTGTDAIAGYNVYRAAGGTTSYQRLNSNTNADTTYTDTNVQSGKTYSYMVKAVDTSGVESKPSNTTSATIP